jgi:hypothetical protein
MAPPGVERTVDLSSTVAAGEDLRFSFDKDWIDHRLYVPVWEVDRSTSPAYTFTPEKAGTNVVGFRVHDGSGGWTGSSIPVFTSNPPEATLTATPQTVGVGENVRLEVTTTDIDPPPDTIVEYVWDLDGDGDYDWWSDRAIDWNFGSPGEHSVGVRVRDRWNATDEARVTVTVEGEEPQGSDGVGITLPPPPVVPPLPSQQPPRPPRPIPVRPPRPVETHARPVQDLDRALEDGVALAVVPTQSGTAQVSLLEGTSGTTARAAKVRVLATRKVKVRKGRRVKLRIRPRPAARARLRRAGRARVVVEVRLKGATSRRAVRLR